MSAHFMYQNRFVVFYVEQDEDAFNNNDGYWVQAVNPRVARVLLGTIAASPAINNFIPRIHTFEPGDLSPDEVDQTYHAAITWDAVEY